MQKNNFSKIVFLLMLSLFLVEYLNPTAIGVRADYPPAPTGSTPFNSQPSQPCESFFSTPHSMIPSEAYRVGDLFPVSYFLASVRSLTEQTRHKEIFHPPAPTL